jgi:threonine aldolase
VTLPTREMRRAMAEAEVGDDVFHGDPTVKRLEEETAAILGKEATLFVPSGSMGNEISVAIQTRPGDAILLERTSHLVQTEAAAITELLGRRYRFLDGDRGRVRAEQVREALANGGARANGIRLVEVENTHNWGIGAVYPLPQLEAVGRAAREHGLPVHLDGARVWNASAATGIPPAAYAAVADTVMVCYSKGLGAPVGSAIAGTAERIAEARLARRMFGGGMRQVGVIAAGALHALRHHRERLPEDHRRAKRLAEAIADTPGLKLDPVVVETNIVIAEVEPHDRLRTFLAAAEDEGVLLVEFGGPGRFRAVTHLDVDDAGVERAIAAVRRAAAAALGVAP